VLFLVGACHGRADGPPTATAQVVPSPVVEPLPVADAGIDQPWTFAVLSDLHVPSTSSRPTVERLVAALVELKPRAVIITGDHTNGSPADGPNRARRKLWWETLTTVLEPLRAAGIPVLPVAGNHDSYLVHQRDGYARTFADLARWAAPLEVTSVASNDPVASAPFSYSVEIDGVHFSLAHIVSTAMNPQVAAWLADDLARSQDDRLRLVFGHVPLSSVVAKTPSARQMAHLGPILEQGHADLYVAGHEHLVWDEDVTLPEGAVLRQILVGCSSGYYNFGPSPASKRRAACTRDLRCRMPNGGGLFTLHKGRKDRLIQHHQNSFTLFTVDRKGVTARPMTIDAEGRVVDFYLEEIR
jgi:predicted phosphodiesterase